jgi:S-adenosylmethionine hydrolase
MVLSGIHTVYAEAKTGEALALVASSGYLEIAVNQGRAVDLLGVDKNEAVGLTVKVRKATG